MAAEDWNSVLEFLRYLKLRPSNISDYPVFLSAFLRGILVRLFTPGKFVTIGQFLEEDIEVTSGGLVFMARKKSEDIGYYVGRTKQSTRKWFHPGKGDIVVDCGSSVGYFSIMAARNGASVTAIEANPETYAILKKNLSLNSLSAVSYNVVLSSGSGIADLYVPGSFTGTGSIVREWPRQDLGISTYQVRSATLDSLTSEMERIDWLLVDVEGSENLVLQGGHRSLEITSTLIIEVWEKNDREVADMIRDAGFNILSREYESPGVYYWLCRKP